MDNTNQITFSKMLEVFKKYAVWIVLVAVLVGCAVAVGAQFLIKDNYTCRMDCLVDLYGRSSSEISTMPRHVSSAITRLKTTDTIKAVVEHAGIEVDGKPAVSLMKSATSISANATDSGFSVIVTTTRPEVSFAMIQSFKDLLPEFIENYRLIEFDIIESPESAPVNPSNGNRALKYGLVGAVAAGLITYIVFLIYTLLDVTIRSEHDLKKYVNLPVLGMIPYYTGEVESGEKIMNKTKSGQSGNKD
ncbi:MAG: hypothetical protein IJU52_06980 [Clostridia bacterium]|nr:hypothetical protein [Clostridia bacterium]